MIQDLQEAIDRLVPLAPPELHEEGERLLKELQEGEGVSERQILQARSYLGQKEYPYRRAYMELCAGDEEQRLQIAALQALEPALKEKIEEVLKHGVHLLDYTKSKLFERQLAPEERYRVEQALLSAHEAVNRQCDERAHERAESFESLVKRYQAEQAKINEFLETLRGLAERSPVHATEILDKVAEFEAAWWASRQGPKEADIRAEINSWMEVFANEEHEPDAQEESLY